MPRASMTAKEMASQRLQSLSECRATISFARFSFVGRARRTETWPPLGSNLAGNGHCRFMVGGIGVEQRKNATPPFRSGFCFGIRDGEMAPRMAIESHRTACLTFIRPESRVCQEWPPYALLCEKTCGTLREVADQANAGQARTSIRRY